MHFAFILIICLIGLWGEGTGSRKNRRKIEAILLALVLFLFAALRSPTVGIDVPSYFLDFRTDATRSYENIISFGLFSSQSYEPVFHIFLHTLSYISEDPQIMLAFIGAFVATSLICFAYSQKGSLFFTVLLFICLRIFPFTLTGLRQAVAMGFVFFASIKLKEKKYISFTILSIIAGLFHFSAIIFLIALPLYTLKKSLFVIITMILVASIDMISGYVVSKFVSNILFNARYGHYFSPDSQGSFSSTTIIVSILLLLYILFKRDLDNIDSTNSGNIRVASAGVIFFILGQDIPSFFRTGYYFIIYLFPLFSQLIKSKFKVYTRIVIVILAVILLVGQYLFFKPGAGTDNYVFFWNS